MLKDGRAGAPETAEGSEMRVDENAQVLKPHTYYFYHHRVLRLLFLLDLIDYLSYDALREHLQREKWKRLDALLEIVD